MTRKKSAAREISDGFDILKAALHGIHDLKREAMQLGLGGTTARPRPKVQAIRPNDAYAILGIERDAPDKMVKEIYLLKAVWYHPDSSRLPGGNEAHFKRISAAFEAIKRERGM